MKGFLGFLGKDKPTTQKPSVVDPLAQAKQHQEELKRHEHRAHVFHARALSKEFTKGRIHREMKYHQRYMYHMDMAKKHRDAFAKITQRHIELYDPAKPVGRRPRED